MRINGINGVRPHWFGLHRFEEPGPRGDIEAIDDQWRSPMGFARVAGAGERARNVGFFYSADPWRADGAGGLVERPFHILVIKKVFVRK